jgi:hypothetical protein
MAGRLPDMSHPADACHIDWQRISSGPVGNQGRNLARGNNRVSIFQKDCPQCAGSNPSEALFCRCGYCYDPSQVRSHDDALTHVVNEEQNYLEYLSARVTQVQAQLEAKLAAQIISPDDATIAAEVLLARQALGSARAEFKLQSEKVESLNRQRKTARRKSPAFKPATVAAPAAKPLNGRPKVAKPALAPPPVASKPVPAPAPAPRMAEQALKLFAPPKVAAQPVTARPVRVIKPAAIAVQQPPPAAPIKPTPVAAPVAVAHKPVAGNAKPIHQPKISDTPGAAFQAAQAAKASRAVTQRSPAAVAAPVPALAALPVIKDEPQKTVVVAVAPAPPETQPNTQECPNCMARLPLTTSKCRCGFDLTSRFEMPDLSLSAADRALLLRNLDYGS